MLRVHALIVVSICLFIEWLNIRHVNRSPITGLLSVISQLDLQLVSTRSHDSVVSAPWPSPERHKMASTPFFSALWMLHLNRIEGTVEKVSPKKNYNKTKHPQKCHSTDEILVVLCFCFVFLSHFILLLSHNVLQLTGFLSSFPVDWASVSFSIGLCVMFLMTQALSCFVLFVLFCFVFVFFILQAPTIA